MPKRLVDLRDERPLLDIVSYGRRGPGRRFTSAEREYISRTARGVPEVMIKVSGGGKSVGAVGAHLRYVDRKGELEIETDEGERRQGRAAARDLLEDWDLAREEQDSKAAYSGAPGRMPAKLVHNIVFSMPRGTPPEKLLSAVRHFAQEKFSLQHRYAMVLHTDQEHPHVHLVLKAVSEQGIRLNIRKATLREWRRDFAESLRQHGVAANATERAVRGVSRTSKTDGIYRAMQRGESTHFEDRALDLVLDLQQGRVAAGVGKEALVSTRREVVTGWNKVGQLLEKDGEHELASDLRRFVRQMMPPRTEREWVAQGLIEHMRRHELEGLHPR